MRVIKTCILKLLLDPDEPQAVRGTLRFVESDEEHAFQDADALLALIAALQRGEGDENERRHHSADLTGLRDL